MLDIGFLELLICGIIALLVLGPERLPSAARSAGRFIGSARRMMSQFTSELDRELKAEDLRKELKKAGDVGLEDVQKTVRDALDEAKKYENMVQPVQDQVNQADRKVKSALSDLWEDDASTAPGKSIDNSPPASASGQPRNTDKPTPSSGDASDSRS